MSGATDAVLALVVMGSVGAATALDIRHGASSGKSWGWLALADAASVAFWALQRAWWLAALVAAFGVSSSWWHWRRRRRQKAPRPLGGKSKAARAKLVRSVREAAKPRPVLRPVPQGAGG
jgi:hypothetical protein